MLTRLFVPKQAVGSSLVYFDLFNAAGSGARLEILSVLPIVSGAVAVTGTLAVDLFLTRTTAVGTGGTAATNGGTSLTACMFSPHDWEGPVESSISARLTPSGGATAGDVLSFRSIFTEETNAAAYVRDYDMARGGISGEGGIVVKPGTGIRVVQGSVASVGNIAFDVAFRTVSR